MTDEDAIDDFLSDFQAASARYDDVRGTYPQAGSTPEFVASMGVAVREFITVLRRGIEVRFYTSRMFAENEVAWRKIARHIADSARAAAEIEAEPGSPEETHKRDLIDLAAAMRAVVTATI